MKVATVNREFQVLRRMFALATEWGKVERVLPRVRMIPGFLELAYLASDRDMSITKRYVHPQEYNTRAAIEKAGVALGGHSSGHCPILNIIGAQPSAPAVSN